MAKYYITNGTLQVIKSVDCKPLFAAVRAYLDTNEYDELEPYFYVSELGFRTADTIQPTEGDKAYSLHKVQRYSRRRRKQ